MIFVRDCYFFYCVSSSSVLTWIAFYVISYGNQVYITFFQEDDDKYYKQSNYEYKSQSRWVTQPWFYTNTYFKLTFFTWRSSKFGVEDVYSPEYRSRSHSKESCHPEVYCNRCKCTGHQVRGPQSKLEKKMLFYYSFLSCQFQPNSCPTLAAAKDDSKKL